jgi:hypothetical protein
MRSGLSGSLVHGAMDPSNRQLYPFQGAASLALGSLLACAASSCSLCFIQRRRPGQLAIPPQAP